MANLGLDLKFTDFLGRFCRGSAQELVLGLVDAEQLSADDLRAIEAKLANGEGARSRARTRRAKR